MSRRHSIKRITGWSVFLALALLLSLTVMDLSSILNLDEYRPQVISVLEKNFDCKAEIGHVRAQLFPPSLLVNRVALIQSSGAPRLLLSGSAYFSFSWKTLWKHQLQFETLRFNRPRFVIHRESDPSGKTQWTRLKLFSTRVGPSRQESFVRELEIRNGSIELWDHTTRPTTRWVVKQLTGDVHLVNRQGAISGISPSLGRTCRLDLRYQQANDFPLEVRLTNVSLATLQPFFPKPIAALAGSADITATLRWEPEIDVHATIAPLRLNVLKNTRLMGTVFYQPARLRVHVKSPDSPMDLTLNASFPKGSWSVDGVADHYDNTLVQSLYDQTWTNRLAGGGQLKFSAQSGPRSAPDDWTASAVGQGFHLAGSSFDLPDWSAKANSRTMVVYVRAATPQGGVGEVVWEKPDSTDALLTVNIASVTVRQLLQVFQMDSKPGAIPANGWNSYGYESWLISRADMESVIRSTGTLDIQDSDIDVAGMHIDLAGSFGLGGTLRQAQLQGGIYYFDLAKRIADFSRSAAPLTGIAQMGFNLTFPLTPDWLRGLSGTLDLNAVNGVLRELKTVYRVMSVLNLTNYFRLRLPQVAAEGVTYQTLQGHFDLKTGLLTTNNLFLRSPNLNIGLQGAADLPMKRIDATLRLEMIRFLEDVLKAVPLTHWIFKKPNKILFPLVVHVKGPWDNPDVS